MNDRQLNEHCGSLRAIKATSYVVIAISNEAEELAKAFMVRAARVRDDGRCLVEDSLAQPLECDLAKRSKYLPVRLRESMRH